LSAGRWLAVCALLAAGESAAFAGGGIAGLWPAAAAIAVVCALFAVPPRAKPGAVPAAAPATAAAAVSAAKSAISRPYPWLAVFFAGFAVAGYVQAGRRAAFEDLSTRENLPVLRTVVPDAVVCTGVKTGGVNVAYPAKYGALPLTVRFFVPEGGELPLPGETWEVCGRLSFRERDDIAERHVFNARGSGSYAKCVEESPGAFSSAPALSAAARRNLARRAAIGVDPASEAAALNRAMLLGERKSMAPSAKNAFVAAGTIHVFAISGLHVMVVAKILLSLMLLAGVPLRAASAAAIPALWFYVYMSGASPSAVRAASMATMYCLAPAVWRKPDAIAAWSATFVAVHVLEPAMLFSTGAQLSFAVMLSIAAWTRWGAAPGGKAGELAAVTLVAWAASVPIVAACFGRWTPGGLLANIVAIPVASFSVVAGVLGVLASFVSDALAAHLNAFAALSTDILSGISRITAAIPYSDFQISPWSPLACVAWYAATALLAVAVSVAVRRRRRFLR